MLTKTSSQDFLAKDFESRLPDDCIWWGDQQGRTLGKNGRGSSLALQLPFSDVGSLCGSLVCPAPRMTMR